MSKNRLLIFLFGMFAIFPAFAIDNALTQKIDANINEYINAVLS
ncbi:TPA: conjugal transfer protein TrbL, partial [Klebsiella pneumoniae]